LKTKATNSEHSELRPHGSGTPIIASFDEIQARGIVLDPNNFSAYEFRFGVATQSDGGARAVLDNPPKGFASERALLDF
jgi:hypothetical protein